MIAVILIALIVVIVAGAGIFAVMANDKNRKGQAGDTTTVAETPKVGRATGDN